MWYLFYLPMLFVPMLALLIALSLGKPDWYKLPKSTAVLWCISTVLLLLVLTNDLHQLVFTFPEGSVWSDTDHGYGVGYFIQRHSCHTGRDKPASENGRDHCDGGGLGRI